MPKLITSRTRIEDLGKPRIIIVGGGFGGLKLIDKLQGVNAQVVLFDKYNHHTFQPLLYQVATSALQTNSIVYPYRKKFRNYKDFYFRLAEVLRINPEENTVETSIGTVKYDYLVVASGSTSNFFGNEELRMHTLPMKTIEDSIALRNRIIKNFEQALLEESNEEMNRLIDYVIIGGGPTGVEIAGALAELRKHVFPRDYKELDMKEMDIHLVEAGPKLLPGMSAASSERTLRYLEQMNVKVHLNTRLLSYDGQTALFDKIQSIHSYSVIWAAGVQAQYLAGLKPEAYASNGRIQVNEFNQVNGYAQVFAIGDVAAMKSSDYPNGHPMMASPAIQQGSLLAKNIRSSLIGKPMTPFRYLNKGSMATIGRNLAVAEIGKFKLSGTIAWMVWLFVHLMSLVGFGNRVFVFYSWMMSYFSYDKSNRFIIGNSFGPSAEKNPHN